MDKPDAAERAARRLFPEPLAIAGAAEIIREEHADLYAELERLRVENRHLRALRAATIARDHWLTAKARDEPTDELEDETYRLQAVADELGGVDETSE